MTRRAADERSRVILWTVVIGDHQLARREEHEALAAFGEAYRVYMSEAPAFFPRLRATGERPSDTA